MKFYRTACALLLLAPGLTAATPVPTKAGLVEGTASADSKIRIYRGIPFAAPPVGALRWKAPQPAPQWTGVKKAIAFGPRCMQGNIFGDMVFRDSGPSEDCLTLNVWTPARSAGERLPVMVWIYGGGFAAGGSSEPRQDGENLARKGVVVVSFNYRLTVFGFFSHPELTRESGHDSSGNYGLLDQVAALEWVKANIASFGGDPNKVTIFGESAGSFSVSALMASPLSRPLVHGAIGESGAFFGSTLQAKPRAETELADAKFAATVGAKSLADLRAIAAADLLAASLKENGIRFAPNVDGYFFPQDAETLYKAGRQAHVPLLAGWNRDEGDYRQVFGKNPPTLQNYQAYAKTQYGEHAVDFLKVYAAENDQQAQRAAQDLAGDQFIGFSTWSWLERHAATGRSPVYRYQFDQGLPTPDGQASTPAYHSAEIEYVFGDIEWKKLPWRDEDRKVSDLMSTYWSNFAKTGNPNGPGLPVWPVYSSETGYPVMHFSAPPQVLPDANRNRYLFLDSRR